MKTKKQKFEDYKLIHNFMYPDEDLKAWISEGNFHDFFYSQWSSMMEVVYKIEKLGYNVSILTGRTNINDKLSKVFISKYQESDKLDNTYKAVIEFIKHYNKKS